MIASGSPRLVSILVLVPELLDDDPLIDYVLTCVSTHAPCSGCTQPTNTVQDVVALNRIGREEENRKMVDEYIKIQAKQIAKAVFRDAVESQ